MRWKYLIPRAIIVALVWAFFVFAFDPLVRRGLISAGQAAVGAKVDVGGFETSFFPPVLATSDVAIANRSKPGTNLFEFSSLKARVAGRPLLRRSVVVKEGALTGLKFNTPRKDSGLLDGEVPDDAADAEAGWFKDKLAEVGRDWLNKAIDEAKAGLDPQQLESVRLANQKRDEWDKRFNDYERRVRDLEMRVRGLETGVKNAKGDTIQRLTAYRRAADDVKELLAESERIRAEFPQMFQTAQTDFQEIDAARKRDVAKIQTKLDILKLDPKEISESLLGPELLAKLDETARWLKWARQKAQAAKVTKPERMRGVDVAFPLHERLPGLLVRKLYLSGEAEVGEEMMPFEGLLTGLTSDPAVYGKPTQLTLDAHGIAAVHVAATIDYTTETPAHRVVATYSLPEPTETNLGDGDNLGLRVVAGRTQWRADVTLTGDALSGGLVLKQRDVAVDPYGGRTEDENVSRVLTAVASSIREIDAQVILGGTLQKPDWKLESNLGPQISEGVNAALTAEVAVRRDQLLAEMDARLKEKTSALESMMNDRYKGLVAGLELNDRGARDLIQRVSGGRSLNLKGLLRR